MYLHCVFGYSKGGIVIFWDKKHNEEKENFLKSNGIWFLVGIEIKWWMYMLFRIFISLFLAISGYVIFSLPSFSILVVFLVSYFGIDHMVKLSNANDNEDMLSDIKLVFDCLRIQVKAGVYITDAINEIIHVINNKRLKRGIKQLSESIMLTNDIDGSLLYFSSLFNSKHIDTLVIILRQALVSGQSAESLDNAFSQMTDIEQAINIKIENALERKIMVLQVMELFGIILLAGFCCIAEFSSMFVAVK